MENQKITLENKEAISVKKTLMKAAAIIAPRKIIMVDQPLPIPAADEVRIYIEGCGICGSDLPVWQGRPWFTYPMPAGAPGHEGYGTIEALGENVSGLKEGDRVAMLSYKAYAEYDIARADQVVKLPDQKLSFPGEPLGCAMNIFERSDIRKNETVAIIGAGFIGNLLICLCKNAGAKVIAISRRDSSLQKAFECGADHVIKQNDHFEILQRINELTNHQGCSRVIEATGKQWPLDLAGEIVGIRGKLIIAGFHQDGLRQINVQNWNWKGIDVINAHERNPQEYIKGMRLAVEAVKDDIINLSSLITHHFKLEELNEAFTKMDLGEEGFLKGVVHS
jgi:threonine dehydrogenase-like Zn-dependent dehydrogenase